MHRAPLFDLAYLHEMLAAPVQPVPAAKAREEARDLVARLECLKALMDADRNAEPPPVEAGKKRRAVH